MLVLPTTTASSWALLTNSCQRIPLVVGVETDLPLCALFQYGRDPRTNIRQVMQRSSSSQSKYYCLKCRQTFWSVNHLDLA